MSFLLLSSSQPLPTSLYIPEWYQLLARALSAQPPQRCPVLVFLTIISLPPSLALCISPSGHRYPPVLYSPFSSPSLSFSIFSLFSWVPRGFILPQLQLSTTCRFLFSFIPLSHISTWIPEQFHQFVIFSPLILVMTTKLSEKDMGLWVKTTRISTLTKLSTSSKTLGKSLPSCYLICKMAMLTVFARLL